MHPALQEAWVSAAALQEGYFDRMSCKRCNTLDVRIGSSILVGYRPHQQDHEQAALVKALGER